MEDLHNSNPTGLRRSRLLSSRFFPFRRLRWRSNTATSTRASSRHIEDYRSGYPRYAALIASHSAFHVCRQFANLRARLLLDKQDKLSMLEKELERVDAEEQTVLFLGSRRTDRNAERKAIIENIDRALAEYDELVDRNHRTLSYEAASPRDVTSLTHWVDGNACLARDETAYLNRTEDLINVVSSLDDRVMKGPTAWIESALIRACKRFNMDVCQEVSRDRKVWIFTSPWIAQVTRAMVVSLIIFLLLTPVALCRALISVALRIVIIVLFTMSFLGALAGLTGAKTAEMFLAGATYATVLVVFVSGTNG